MAEPEGVILTQDTEESFEEFSPEVVLREPAKRAKA
jgi:hypothetical protein